MAGSVSRTLRVVDSHTEGEPTRVVLEGCPDLGAGSLAQRRTLLREKYDWVRRACCLEPRGADAWVGGVLVPPHDASAEFGIIYFNNVGYLNMCIHGTIGLVATLAHLRRIGPGAHRIDTPVGVVTGTLHEDGRVTVANVPSYRHQARVRVEVPGYGAVTGDIAWGGNWFFLIEGGPIPVTTSKIGDLTKFTCAVKDALAQQKITGRDGGEIDHIEVFAPGRPGHSDSRNFVLCPGSAYDRSPCGTGTSAKLACLHADGKLSPGAPWRQAGILDTVFEGRVRLENGALIPEVAGRAWITAESTLLLSADDPFAEGIVL